MTTFPSEIQGRIRRYLDDVSRHLSGVSEKSRQETLQDLESHIHEALARRAPQDPSLSDLEAILAEMDPPESFGQATAEPASETVYRAIPDAHVSLWPVSGAILILLAALLFATFAIKAQEEAKKTSLMESRYMQRLAIHEMEKRRLALEGKDPSTLEVPARPHMRLHYRQAVGLAVFCTGLLVLSGSLLGAVGLRRIRRSEGRLRGLGLAYMEVILLPLILFSAVLCGLFDALNLDQEPALAFIGLLLLAGLDIWLIRLGWRAARRVPVSTIQT